MAPTNVLSEKDANNSLKTQLGNGDATKPDIKSMEYHRQVLKSKMEEEKYGRRITNANTNTNTATTPASHTAAKSSGLGTATATVGNSAAANPTLASYSMMDKNKPVNQAKTMAKAMTINNKQLTGLPADPPTSGVSDNQQYVSPSDGIMSPCTAKLNALKGRHAGKAKPKSLFAQASARKFDSGNVLGARNAAAQTTTDSSTNAGDDF